MVSKIDILSQFFNINPDGDAELVVDCLNNILAKDDWTIEGIPITFDFICKQYQQYCNVWDIKHEGQEDRWIKDTDKKKKPYDFLNAQIYKQKFEISKTGRDYYLFGDLKTSRLKELHKQFLNETGL